MISSLLSSEFGRLKRGRGFSFWTLFSSASLAFGASVGVATNAMSAQAALITDGGAHAKAVLAALADGLLALDPRRLPVGRQLPDQVALGATSEVALVVRNPTDRNVRLAVADELATSLRAGTRRWRARVPARSEVRLATSIRPGRRGRWGCRRRATSASGRTRTWRSTTRARTWRRCSLTRGTSSRAARWSWKKARSGCRPRADSSR